MQARLGSEVGFRDWGCGGQRASTVGRLVFVYDGHNAATLFSYHVMGRINWQWDCTPTAFVNGGCNSVRAQYNLAGDLTQLTYPDGRVVTNNYNSGNQLSQVQFAKLERHVCGHQLLERKRYRSQHRFLSQRRA